MAKATPWIKIKAEYLQGITPKELAEKYNLTAKQISDKANEDKWVGEKAEISENIRNDVEARIKKLTNEALMALEKVIKNTKAKDADKISASKAILDISGLKISKRELTGKDGEALIVQKEYILPEEVQKFKEHYNQVMGG